MASGNFISSTGVNLNLYITWVSTKNIPGNYSDVLMTAYLRHSSLYVGARSSQVLKAEGATATYDAPAISYGSSTIIDTQIGQKTIRVYHNQDGTMPSCDLYGSYYFNGTYNGKSISTITASKTVALDAIPRKSIATVTPSVEVNGTNQASCSITRYDSSFTHKVTFYIGDFVTTPYKQEYSGVATSQSYAIPLAWMNAIPSAISGQAKVRVETFSGATSLGYNEYTFDITVPTTVIPVVTDIAFSKVADAFSSGIFAKGISKISLSGVTVTNQYSATTASFKGVAAAYTSLPETIALRLALAPDRIGAFELGPFSFSGTGLVSSSAKDSRSQVSSPYSEQFTIYDYAPPSVTVTAERCDVSGNPDPSGGYIKIRFIASISPVNNDNSKVYSLKYKKTSDSTWTSIDVSGLTGYTADQTYIRAASASYTWEVYGSAQDKVSTVSKTVQASTALVLMDFLSGGTGMAIGKVSETSDLLEVNMDAQFDKNVKIGGVVGGVVPTGSILMWPAAAPPTGWQICDGSAAETAALQAIVGANVPDLRTRVPVGKNASGTFGTLLGSGGAETHTLASSEMPSHTHTQNSHNHTQNAHDHGVRYKSFNIAAASGYIVLRRRDAGDAYDGEDGDAAGAVTATNIAATATNQNTGGGGAHNNLQPYLVLNFIIKT